MEVIPKSSGRRLEESSRIRRRARTKSSLRPGKVSGWAMTSWGHDQANTPVRENGIYTGAVLDPLLETKVGQAMEGVGPQGLNMLGCFFLSLSSLPFPLLLFLYLSLSHLPLSLPSVCPFSTACYLGSVSTSLEGGTGGEGVVMSLTRI